MTSYKVCECGHRDRWHQTCNPETILTEGQRPCYGVEGVGCDCEGWTIAFRYADGRAHEVVDKSPDAVTARWRLANRGHEVNYGS